MNETKKGWQSSMLRHCVPWGGGVNQQKSRNHVRTTIGCFLIIGKKNDINFGSTIAYLNCETCDYM